MNTRRDPSSSLELLLDTMCNTFGGVMFIAISLIVMISMIRQTVTPLERSEARGDRLRAEIAALKSQLDDGSGKALAEQISRLEAAVRDDPRTRLAAETAALERAFAALSARIDDAATRLERLRSEAAEQAKRSAALADELRRLDAGVAADGEALRLAEAKISGLKSEIEAQPSESLNFAVLAENRLAPYFMMIRDGSVWPVGPEGEGGAEKPNPAVKYVETASRVECSPLPGRGVRIFAGEELSPEFRALLTGLPGERVPRFIVSGKDARIFFRLREILKRERTMHGFTLVNDADTFIYAFSDKVKYEY